jgi:hypothetical protein
MARLLSQLSPRDGCGSTLPHPFLSLGADPAIVETFHDRDHAPQTRALMIELANANSP